MVTSGGIMGYERAYGNRDIVHYPYKRTEW